MDPEFVRRTRADLESMLMWLRNGSTMVGNDPLNHQFREKCLERAYIIASQDLTPAILLALGQDPSSVYNQHLQNLIDVSAVLQKQTIMSPIYPPPNYAASISTDSRATQ